MSGAWLVDKSALLRLKGHELAALWSERVSRGLVRITSITLLEVGFSARNAPDWQNLIHGLPIAAMPIEMLTPAIEARAVEVQGILARRSQHRAPSIPDLFVAATAELAGLTVLHCDKDFELIADVTGQTLARIADHR